jgi:hypothetical protein
MLLVPPVIKMLLPVMFMVASWQLATRGTSWRSRSTSIKFDYIFDWWLRQLLTGSIRGRRQMPFAERAPPSASFLLALADEVIEWNGGSF